jgi:RimJ/RimL family protein N-acetyltransferase
MEVGWRLARHAWHQGFATEAATAAVGVAFSGVGLGRVWSMTSVLNRPSQLVMLRIGTDAFFDKPVGHPCAAISAIALNGQAKCEPF